VATSLRRFLMFVGHDLVLAYLFIYLLTGVADFRQAWVLSMGCMDWCIRKKGFQI